MGEGKMAESQCSSPMALLSTLKDAVKVVAKPAKTPAKGDSVHDVVDYDSTTKVPDKVAAFLSPGAEPGRSIFVVALPGHAADIRRRLPDAEIQFFDAEKTAEALLIDGMPDGRKFNALIGEPIRKAAKRGPVYAYGEMVAVLCLRNQHKAALRLVGLWNRLLEDVGANLLCGYPKTVLARDEDAKIIRQLKAEHGAGRLVLEG